MFNDKLPLTPDTTASAKLHDVADRIDAACSTGALVASDAKSELAKKHRWRIEGSDALDWKRRGFPTTT